MTGKKKIQTSQSGSDVLPLKRPRRRNKDLSIRKLLDAGLEIFSKYGFDAATTKQIAKKAGVNEALIARYFKSKAGLLHSVILTSVNESKAKAYAQPVADTLVEEILFQLRQHCTEFREKQCFNRLAVSRLIVDPKLAREIEKKLQIKPDHAVIQRLKKFQDSGEIPADRDLVDLAYLLQFQSMGILMMNVIHCSIDQELIDQVVEETAPILAQGFRVSPQAVGKIGK